ncbi:MAG TPA: hypothetical protein ENF93_00590, partial [Ignisphaera sp.]|nr:hypothetical protein [Ignisphaera sp.]
MLLQSLRIPASLCAKCKGYKKLCNLPECPLLQRFRTQVMAFTKIKGLSVVGSTPPTTIVGERGYPKVSLIIAVPPEVHGDEAKRYDDPKGWWGRISLSEVLSLRSSMVSGI